MITVIFISRHLLKILLDSVLLEAFIFIYFHEFARASLKIVTVFFTLVKC